MFVEVQYGAGEGMLLQVHAEASSPQRYQPHNGYSEERSAHGLWKIPPGPRT